MSFKYQLRNDKFYNLKTGEPIPQDEPVFIFRGKDLQALTVLEFYYELLDGPNDEAHRASVREQIELFYQFKERCPERMKQPD